MSIAIHPRDDINAGFQPVTESRRLNWLSLAFMACVALYFLLPGNALIRFGWHYFGGGSEFQKIHPATFLLVTIFGLLVVLNRVFRRRCIAQLRTDYAFVAFAVAATATSLFAVAARGASAANLIETFALALIVRIALVAVPRWSLSHFRTFVDLLFIAGAATVFGEFVLRQSIFFENPSYYDHATGQMVTAEFRAAGIFGHPLTAAGFFSLYAILNLVATPMRMSTRCVARLSLSALAFVAILPTGGRAALVVGALVLTAFVAIAALRSLAKGSFSRAGVVWSVCFLTAVALALPIMERLDVFDVMLARFERDDGSALSRQHALQIILEAPFQDLLFGMSQQDVLNLQKQFGLIAIENSWINFALICGLFFTVPLLLSYVLFLFKSNPRYCTSGIYYVAVFQFVLSNATNDLWSKNTGFAASVAVIFAFLRKDMIPAPPMPPARIHYPDYAFPKIGQGRSRMGRPPVYSRRCGAGG